MKSTAFLFVPMFVLFAFADSGNAQNRPQCTSVDVSTGDSCDTCLDEDLCGGKCWYPVQAIGGGDCYRDVNGTPTHTCSVKTPCKKSGFFKQCNCNDPSNEDVAAVAPNCELVPDAPATAGCITIVPPEPPLPKDGI